MWSLVMVQPYADGLGALLVRTSIAMQTTTSRIRGKWLASTLGHSVNIVLFVFEIFLTVDLAVIYLG